MSNQIIIIAEVSKSEYSLAGYVNVLDRVTEIFDTEYLTQAHKMLFDKYDGYEIEILYVFDSNINLNEQMVFLTKNTRQYEK